jgi:hypothetical protein
MILLSVAIGIPINGGDKGWFSLVGAEFTGPVELLKYGSLTQMEIIIWILLLISHFAVISLLFLTKKRYFRDLLIMAPASFLLIYIAHSSIAIVFLLIPFIILWIGAIVMQNKIS